MIDVIILKIIDYSLLKMFHIKLFVYLPSQY